MAAMAVLTEVLGELVVHTEARLVLMAPNTVMEDTTGIVHRRQRAKAKGVVNLAKVGKGKKNMLRLHTPATDHKIIRIQTTRTHCLLGSKTEAVGAVAVDPEAENSLLELARS